jgi:hypothetical protein
MKKKTKITLHSQAVKLANQIEDQYYLLTGNTQHFFDTYHDNLRIQMEASHEEAGEVEVYEDKTSKHYNIKHAKQGIYNLQETLKYCKAVIELQKQTDNLPRSIYG